ncbi:MAG: 5-methyltetrahydropteroyltriglutamate--homocysteine S-methyltransferase, partial [Rhodospirillales bacterium]|nr:5-methyltetrahydropteroyltriglutamate--homocysteine S-methyltransferase [Rhodospirillales bacterium]
KLGFLSDVQPKGNTMSFQDPGKPPFRADHVGSLLRPQRLHDARAKRDRGEISDTDLSAIEDDCIREAIQGQEKAGVRSITDGEFRRFSWHYDFLCSLEGIDESAPHQGPTFQAGQSINSLEITSKIKNNGGIMLDHFRFLRDNTKETPKFCIPSPSLAYHRGGRDLIDTTVYPDIEEFWEDLCAAYRDEIKFLYAEGCRYLQLDDTTFAMLCDPKVRAQMSDRGDDPAELIRTYARGIAKALEDRPSDMAVTVHMCRGNFKSSWIAEGGYEPVAEDMFADVPVDAFFMEWESDRAGGFEPLRYAPRDKMVVLGLVSSKIPELENKDDLKHRVDEAAQHFPIDNLCLSPQCGFASMAVGNLISEDDQWRKLELCAETAADIWG